MDRIAAKAEVSKRTVYNHFQSKEELFSEILRRLWATSAAQLDMTYHSQRPLREQLRSCSCARCACSTIATSSTWHGW